MNNIPTLQLENLVLRPFAPADAQTLFEINQQEGVLRYFPNQTAPPLEKVERFVVYQQAHWEKYGYGNWAVSLEEQAEMIGWAGLQYLPETGETEVGYLLGRPFWGRGYASRAAAASIRFGFEHFGFDEIIALVHPDNAASLRVAAKCGLKVVERKTYWGLDMVRHSIRREDMDAK